MSFAGSRKKLLSPVLLSICAAFAVPVLGQNVEIIRSDFEKGTGNWEKRGSGTVSIKSTKKMAANGKKSLRVAGRRENWQGAQLNVTNNLKAGKTYLFTASVRLVDDQNPDVIKMTMQRGDKQWEGVAAIQAKADEWSTLSGKFKPDGSDPYLLIYFEATGDRTAFYVDDFKIEMVEPPKQSGILLTSDFQDKTAQNWTIRGENVQMFSAAIGDARSLKVGGRTESWHGLVLDVSPVFFEGRTYTISVSAKLAEGESPDTLKLSVLELAPDGSDNLVAVSRPAEVTDADWVRLSGEYKVKTEDNKHVVTVEAKGAKTSYYIDDFELKIP